MGRLSRYQLAPPEPPRLSVPRAGWPSFSGPLEKLPARRHDLYELFGNPGSVDLDKQWKKKNIVQARIPGVNPFPCHRLAEPYFREAFRRALIASPCEDQLRGWSFVFRHERRDPSRPLSKHSWGIAIDIDPHLNGGRYFPEGKAPALWSQAWTAVWPDGLPRAFVSSFCSVGFRWGGDWDSDGDSSDHTFLDPMHFELCARWT